MTTLLVILLLACAVLNVVGIPLQVARIGKPRKPLTATDVNIAIVVNVLVTALIVWTAVVIAS